MLCECVCEIHTCCKRTAPYGCNSGRLTHHHCLRRSAGAEELPTSCEVLNMNVQYAVFLQVPLMSEIVQAWLYTADNNMGIFDCDFDAKAFKEATVTDAEEATHGDDNVSSTSPAPYGDTLVPTTKVDAISAHHIWVGFFLQAWQVATHCCATHHSLSRCILTCQDKYKLAACSTWDSMQHPSIVA